MVQKDVCIPVFVAALFAIAKTWKQPKCPSTEKWIKMWWLIHTQSGILLSHEKEWNNAICSNMVGPRHCYTEWSKSDRKGELLYDIPYVQNLKRNYTKSSFITEILNVSIIFFLFHYFLKIFSSSLIYLRFKLKLTVGFMYEYYSCIQYVLIT